MALHGQVDPELVGRARSLVERSSKIVALTGAGISTDSGIPDFRGPEGIWTKNPAAERLATIDRYLADPDVRRAAWKDRLRSSSRSARPNAGHMALVALERSGRLDTLVTQNIDGLHQLAGSDPSRVVELHGTMQEVICWSCKATFPMGEILDRVRAGEEDPACTEDGGRCGGILKSATISFGQALDPPTLRRAEDAASSSDLMLAVGTSLGVFPAAGLVPLAHRAGSEVVIVNAQATPYDDLASVVLNGSISELLPMIVGSGEP